MEMDLVKNAYEASVMLSNVRLLLLWDEKISRENYIALKIFIDKCKENLDDIINKIEKYCKEEEE